MRSSSSRIYRIAALLILLTGLILLLFPQSPFDLMRLAARPFSKDGVIETLAPHRTAALDPLARLAGILLTAGGAFGVIWRKKARLLAGTAAGWLSSFRSTLFQDFTTLLRSLIPDQEDTAWIIAIAVVTIAGLLLRLPYLEKPMGHDEAYTVIAFASRPLLAAISDYHLPNNHLFHTLLVHLAMRFFGGAPWAVRLPALLAGVLLIPAVFLAGKQQYQRSAGLIGASLVAALPVLVDLSTSARGYSLVALMAMAGFLLAAYLQRHDNLAAWLLLAVCGALGMWSIPLMLYPLGSAYTWLALDWGRKVLFPPSPVRWKDISRWRLRFVTRMTASGLAALFLTLLLYLPVFYANGVEAVTANSFVLPLSLPELIEVIPGRAGETVDFWFGKWIAGGGWLIAGGFLLSLALHRRFGKQTIPLQLAMIGFCAAAVLIQRPNPWAKLWSSLLPLILLSASAGWVSLFSLSAGRLCEGIRRPRISPASPPLSSQPEPASVVHSSAASGKSRRFPWLSLSLLTSLPLSLLVSLLILGWSFWQTNTVSPGMRLPPGAPEQAARFIQARYQPGDLVACTGADSPALFYYLAHLGVAYPTPRELRRLTFQRVFVVVDAKENQTLESVLREFEEELRGYSVGEVEESWEGDGMEVVIMELKGEGGYKGNMP